MALATQDLSWFHTNFSIVDSISVKNMIGILIEIALNLYIALDSTDTLTTLIFLVCGCGISFYLLVSFSVCFINVL